MEKDLTAISALVYDFNTDYLYWVDREKGSFEVSSTTSGFNYRAVLRRDLKKPISLALCAELKTWFVGLRNEPNQVIFNLKAFLIIFFF